MIFIVAYISSMTASQGRGKERCGTSVPDVGNFRAKSCNIWRLNVMQLCAQSPLETGDEEGRKWW